MGLLDGLKGTKLDMLNSAVVPSIDKFWQMAAWFSGPSGFIFILFLWFTQVLGGMHVIKAMPAYFTGIQMVEVIRGLHFQFLSAQQSPFVTVMKLISACCCWIPFVPSVYPFKLSAKKDGWDAIFLHFITWQSVVYLGSGKQVAGIYLCANCYVSSVILFRHKRNLASVQ